MPSQDSKQNFALLRDRILAKNGKEYWRSVEEFVDAPEFEEFVKREYPDHAETWDDALSRRNFIKVMGASLALAGLSGCVIQPPEKIVPYVTAPSDSLPGRPLFYATSYTLSGVSMGLLAKAYEGRPVKIEGNPDHPGSRGATDIRAQASLLDMYDPDRAKQITFRAASRTWQQFTTELRSALDIERANGGAGVRFLTETVTSPTIISQFKQIAAELPQAKWVQYEAVNGDNALAGAKMAFGSPAQAIYHFNRAERILSLDADIFSGFNVGYLKDYAAGKSWSSEKKDISRLYVVETSATLTGAKADHRLAVKPSQLAEVAKAIAQRVGVSGANSTYNGNTQWIDAMARDLSAFKGRSLVVAGDSASPIVHALANAMNGALGNIGQTVEFVEPFSPGTEKLQLDQLRELLVDIDANKVKMLVILGGNPAYSTPADLRINFERINNKVPLRVYVGSHDNETAEICHWLIPEKHYLEAWSDGRAYDGTVSMTQPLIAPLYDSHNVSEVIQLFFRENYDKRDSDIIKEFWQTQNVSAAKPTAMVAVATNTAAATTNSNANTVASAPSLTNTAANRTPQASTASPAPAATSANAATAFEDRWRKYVHDGLIANTAATPKGVSANAAFLAQPQNPVPQGSGIEINILPDPNIYDGRYANNGWLQELPKPLNKVTWDNVALVSPKTAETLGVNQNRERDREAGGEQGVAFVNTKGTNQFSDLVTLTYQGANIKVPMWVTPGQPDEVITIFMGYGRKKAGQIGTGIGYNVFDARRSDAMDWAPGNAVKTGETTTITSTQIHFNMEGRDLLRSWDLEKFNEDPKMHTQPDHYDESMYPHGQHEEVYKNNHKWGMTIDLNKCVGCNACVLACQSENNIPVVGRDQVDRHRMMHWLRIDTYFGGDNINEPGGPYFQPVLCQQCEQAPCEVVCPVHATVHSAEGLNDMVYNRCVGTRYCSNNCPYKVRRFNFLLYQDWDTPQYKLMRNPEVSIRSRGVMEKCTYCTQRIAAARIEAEKDGSRKIRDGEIVTACQAACPTDVFSFGDMHDQNSKVAKAKKDPRDYTLLNNLNTQPRTTYLAELRNQNKEMPDYREMHFAGVVYEEAEGEETTENKSEDALGNAEFADSMALKEKEKDNVVAGSIEPSALRQMHRKLVPAMVEGDHTFGSVSDKIGDVTLKKRTPFHWFIGFAIAFMVAQALLFTTVWLLINGIGIWGNNQPVGWAFDIINFVWWIGIGHAGTLISAILLLLNQKWRTSINRFAEAMTLFAVACAAMFPLLHTGRPWLAAYWLFPYPNVMGIWPQFRSPLIWDVFAVSTYATVSLLFWYVGLIPDLATLRDRAKNKFFKFIYAILSWGWRGSARHWHRYELAYLILAGISTPLVLSVHSIVSLDFSVSQVPGWHATFFPPYFVAGAIYAGFAMVLILCIPLRNWYNMKDFITHTHLVFMGKVMLATGLIVVYSYVMEAFFGWYSSSQYEYFMIKNRIWEGPYWWMYWLLILCNGLSIQLLWFKRFRESEFWLFVISIIVSVGMWLERFVIIVTSLNRDFLPSSWANYAPRFFDYSMFIGTIGFFFTLIYLFVRFVPIISIFEVRTLLPAANVHGHPQDFDESVLEVEYTYDKTDPPNRD